MNVLLLNNENNTSLDAILNTISYIHNVEKTTDFDVFRESLVNSMFDLVIIDLDDDMGVLGCEFTRKALPNIPLFWISNKRDYWAKSYDLNCTYFTTKPIISDRIIHVFERFEKSLK